MRRVSPIDEKRNKPVGDQWPLAGDMPGEKNARWRAPASRYHRANWHTAAMRFRDDLRQIGALRCPGDEPWDVQIVDVELPRLQRLRLIGIRSDDLEVRRRTEGDERVASALAWMLPARGGMDAKQCLDVLHTSGQVRRRVDQMIDGTEQCRAVTRLCAWIDTRHDRKRCNRRRNSQRRPMCESHALLASYLVAVVRGRSSAVNGPLA